jgi:hypothetical protein
MAQMADQYNFDHVTTLKQGVAVIEDNYISKVQAYLTSKELGFNNSNFTKSYK